MALPAATAYKCVDATGVTIFSDVPCKGRTSEQIYIHENFSVGESLSPEEIEMLQEIEAREKQAVTDSAAETTPPEDIPEPEQAKTPVDKTACKKANEDLMQWRKVMNLGYPPEEKGYYEEELRNKLDARRKSCGLTD